MGELYKSKRRGVSPESKVKTSQKKEYTAVEPNKNETEVQRVVVVVSGVELDITQLPPLTMGDKRALKREYGVHLSHLMDAKLEPNPDGDAALCLLALRKVRSGTTPEEVDAMSLPAVQRVLTQVVRRTVEEIDRPFSTPSTSSPPSTGGTIGK